MPGPDSVNCADRGKNKYLHVTNGCVTEVNGVHIEEICIDRCNISAASLV